MDYRERRIDIKTTFNFTILYLMNDFSAKDFIYLKTPL